MEESDDMRLKPGSWVLYILMVLGSPDGGMAKEWRRLLQG